MRRVMCNDTPMTEEMKTVSNLRYYKLSGLITSKDNRYNSLDGITQMEGVIF